MKIFNPFADMPDNPLTRAIKEGYKPLAYAGGFSLVSNLLYLALPIFTFQIYGRVLSSYSVPTLLVLTFMVMLAFLISGLIDDFRAKVLINYGVIMDQRVSGRVFSALFDTVIRGNPSARSQALRDLDSFRQMLTGPAFGTMFDLPWMPVFMIVLLIIDPIIGLVTIGGAVLLFLITLFQDRATRPALKEANEAALRSYAFTDAALRNGEVVRAMGMVEPLGSRWATFRSVTMERSASASERASVISNISKFVRQAIQVLIIAIGAYLVVKGKIHSGLLFANMILAARALQPIERLVGSWDALTNGYRSYQRLNSLFADYRPSKASTTLPKPLGQLSVEGVNFAPQGATRFVLQGVNFKIEPGEMLGIIGPSGAGKSSLARLMVGIWQPNSGNVRLDGADVYSWDRSDFGRHVGYLPQDTELFSGSIRDNIARFRADVDDEQVVRAAQVAGVHQLILRLPSGYDTDLGESGHVLSAGQRQRVGLARALLGNPRLIVLDEPNAALDAEGEEALVKALDALKAGGSTIVIVSHKPSVFRSADKMLMLRDGRMEMFGPREQVMARVVQPAAPRAIEAGR
ncbi:type I secretion system permease/ATPase [Phenylobacterium sp. NIBR 498073]|uniref:type I secretion system permease/ATPase n=1 Tax=Phenylobacterium sp. NIBR 498073 TaxID=3015177 RepID=UPI0022B3E53C|nr:type I secretion system permease/ATPase [Phenylobacterium sp. NIBR 498073]WGU39701.1 type I secretion system permease/ATPase [Phenylobacterium sp. NIBR 498073]